MSTVDDELGQMIADGLAPEWARCKDPVRVRELLTAMEQRELTDAETQDLYEASDGPRPSIDYQKEFLRTLNERIDAAEKLQK